MLSAFVALGGAPEALSKVSHYAFRLADLTPRRTTQPPMESGLHNRRWRFETYPTTPIFESLPKQLGRLSLVPPSNDKRVSHGGAGAFGRRLVEYAPCAAQTSHPIVESQAEPGELSGAGGAWESSAT